MRNKEFNKSQKKVNLSVHQKDGHRLNSQKNPLMAARGKNVAEWSR